MSLTIPSAGTDSFVFWLQDAIIAMAKRKKILFIQLLLYVKIIFLRARTGQHCGSLFVVIFKCFFFGVPIYLSLYFHRNLMKQASAAGTMTNFDRRRRLFPGFNAI